MRFVLLTCVVACMTTMSFADGMDEVNEWRRRSGLPPFIEDPAMTQFAAMKARYRAERNLRDGHQGPSAPAGWHEGTGEAQPMWGWLTCEMESDFRYAGAAMCVGPDGTRFMVLVCRQGSGRALIGRSAAPVHRTAHLTPNPPRVGQPATYSVAKAPITNGRVSHNLTERTTVPAGSTSFRSATAGSTFAGSVSTGSVSTSSVAKQPCPQCGKVH